MTNFVVYSGMNDPVKTPQKNKQTFNGTVTAVMVNIVCQSNNSVIIFMYNSDSCRIIIYMYTDQQISPLVSSSRENPFLRRYNFLSKTKTIPTLHYLHWLSFWRSLLVQVSLISFFLLYLFHDFVDLFLN